MQVALYLKHFPASGSPIVGGSATAVNGLAAGFAHHGADTVVLCEGAQRCSTLAAGGFRIECFRNMGRYRSFGVAPELCDFAADTLQPSGVCLLHGIFHPSCFALARALRRRGVPYIANPQDPYDHWMFGRNPHLKWPYWYLFERRYLRDALAVQLLDRRHEGPLRRLGIGTPAFETPNGVTSAQAEKEPPPRAGDGGPSFLFLGRLDAYNKGLDTLIEGFASIARSQGQRATLTLRGPDWGDRARLSRRVDELGLTDRVAFLDPDYGRSSVELIADHDLLCLPSRFEGFGLVALEAMLASRVLLVSERAGVARHVAASGCGLVVPPSTEGVAQGLAALLGRRTSWTEMGRRGRRYVLEQLQWNHVAGRALESYARLLN
jgi:glycosyltransferase involved in cell wall biosynthesis